jgi:hypothetical protein
VHALNCCPDMMCDAGQNCQNGSGRTTRIAGNFKSQSWQPACLTRCS